MALPPIGATICKEFPSPHGRTWGEVVFYTFHGNCCRVVYENGFQEDLYHNLVQALAKPCSRNLCIPSHLRQISPVDFQLGASMTPPPPPVPGVAPQSSLPYVQSGQSVAQQPFIGNHVQMVGFGNTQANTSASEPDLSPSSSSQGIQAIENTQLAAARVSPTLSSTFTTSDNVSSSSSSPPLSSSSDEEEEEEEVRRSQRARTSTVVYVGKDAVKRANNYSVTGMTYQYGSVSETSPPPAKIPKVKTAKPSGTATPKAPRYVSPQEQARLAMKKRIEENIAKKEEARRAFFHRHANVFEPFDATLPEAPTVASLPSLHTEVMQPDTIQADLRDYQLEGLNFMSQMYQQNVSMILGDEMGLGKTLQTLSLVCHLKEHWKQSGPSLVICPLSVLYSWGNEATKWAPSLKCLRFHSSQADTLAQQSFEDYDVVITTYEMVSTGHLSRLWSRQFFNLVVLDEGHRIKCAKTLISQAVRKLHSECRIILTGTPLANNLTELWALLNFLEPTVFTTSQPFDDAFDLTLNKVDNTKLLQAHDLLKVMMLRRLKSKVEQKLPPKIETRVICPLSTTQIWWYKALLIKDIGILAGDGKGSKAMLNNLLMQLRKCCLHPFLFKGVEEDPDKTSLEDLIGNSGKLAVLDLLLQSLYKKGHRVILFSQFTQVLDILDDYCRLRGWKFCRFDGGTARARRNHIINNFNAKDSDKFIFLMSTRSGGMGINLQTADTCILFDSDWNPSPDIQAIGRTHRLGQTKTVHIYRLCTLGTVEQRMQERAEKKLYLDRMVTRDDAVAIDTDEEENTDKLLSTLRFGCNAVFGSAMKVQELPTQEEIEIITDRTRTEDYTNGKLVGNADMAVNSFDAEKKFVDTMEFGGIDFKKLRKEHQKKIKDIGEIQDIWRKRQRKNRIKMVNGEGSGYGCKAVPVLASNDYDLETGEKSVFDRELQGRQQQQIKKKKKADFRHLDMCQVCGDGGKLVLCPRCPVSLHFHCAGVRRAEELKCCSHHNCSVCGKSPSAAGGLIFPCLACSNAYCEDDLPQNAIHLDDGCKPMEKLGYFIKNGIYVICSKQCEVIARDEYNWKPSVREDYPCPKPIDVSHYFGGTVDETIQKPAEVEVVEGKRKRKPVSYAPPSRTSPSKKQTLDAKATSNDQVVSTAATTGKISNYSQLAGRSRSPNLVTPAVSGRQRSFPASSSPPAYYVPFASPQRKSTLSARNPTSGLTESHEKYSGRSAAAPIDLTDE